MWLVSRTPTKRSKSSAPRTAIVRAAASPNGTSAVSPSMSLAFAIADSLLPRSRARHLMQDDPLAQAAARYQQRPTERARRIAQEQEPRGQQPHALGVQPVERGDLGRR